MVGPGPKVGVVGLDLELRPDLLPVGASPGVLYTPWPWLRQCVLPVAVGTVAILESVLGKVATTSDAIVMLTSASFTVADVKVHLSTKVSTL